MKKLEIEILRDCTIKAIQYLDKNPWNSKNNSKTGDLVYEGKLYPTKPILWEVEKQIEKDKLEIKIPSLSGGEQIFKFFETLGFEIKRKKMDTFKKLIEKYITILQTKGEPNEKYKYTAIDTFQTNWDIDSVDFLEMFKKSFSKVSNLLYQNSWGFIIKAAEYFPEETRLMFKNLYNEENDLSERIKEFQTQSEVILEKQKELLKRNNLSAQQDERTISVYLAFRYPEKYILYKSDYYQNYCDEAGVSSQKTGERFTHLNLLADSWIEHNQLNDETFKETYRSFYPKPYWNDDRLMIQNILYVCYREERNGASLINTLNKFDYDDLFNYFAFLDEIISHFNLKENDKKLVFNYNERQLKFTIGQRYVWNIRAINSKDYTFRAIATNPFGLSHEKFDGLPTAFLNNETNFNLITSNKTSIFEAILNELSRAKVSGYAKHNDSTIEKLVFDLDYREHIFSQLDRNKKNDIESQINNNPAMNSFPLNQILYGAPGTGKTYTTKKLAIEIIDGITYNDTTEVERQAILSRYNELASLNQIHFTTFHQSMSYEDFIEGIKPENVDEQIKYEVKNGIFKQISEYALYKNETNFEEAYGKLIKEILEKDNDYLVLNTPKNKAFRVNVNSNNNLNLYTSENINKQGTLTKEKLFKQINGHQEFNGWEGYVTSVIQYLKEKHNLKINNTSIEKKFVLIIDEINRGNVSSIFGELITLLEEDKRKGNKEEIEVILPYSHDKFSVPNNLYIIGTMNTADRSVEALDTALRRRFSFVEMQSNPEKLSNVTLKDANNVDLVKMLACINQRIELLIDKDHQIGHSFFINLKNLNSLRTVFKNKIIPLLEEYFFGDFGKIGLVLGENFISVKNNSNKGEVFAKFSAYDEVDFLTEKKVYQIKNCDELNALDFISIYE